MNVDVKDSHYLLLDGSFDHGQLHPTIIGNLCAQGEILKCGLLHLPLYEDPLLREDIHVVVEGHIASQRSIVDRRSSEGLQFLLFSHWAFSQITFRHGFGIEDSKVRQECRGG